jgi:hypothetical protein
MSQSITIKTVTAPPFQESKYSKEMLTPRLKLVVSYTKGGTSFITGNKIPRGYDLSVDHDRHSDQGFTSVLLDSRCGNPTASLEPGARFSAKTLERIADDVRNGKHDALIAQLYDKAKANRSEHTWPESILPLIDDSLLASVVEAVLVGAL